MCVLTDKSGGGERGGVFPQEAASGRHAVLLRSERAAVQEESGHAGAHAGIHTRSGLTPACHVTTNKIKHWFTLSWMSCVLELLQIIFAHLRQHIN